MTQSLYEQNKDAWDAIGLYWPNTAEMARHFAKFVDMERALGYGPSVIVKWVKKRGGLSRETDRRAKVWLDNATAVVDRAPKVSTKASGRLLLVACDEDTAGKAHRVLSILGCEVTEV